MNYGGDVKKGYFILFFLLNSTFAEEMSISRLFSDFQNGNNSSQRIIEERLEQDISKFRSVEASRLILPFGEIQSQESLWGVADPRVLNVDVVLKLKKRKRLTLNEYRGISDLVSSSLSEKDRVIQVNIKDEEGFRWSEDGEDSRAFFKAAEVEQEIQSFLKDRLARKEIIWTHINVSEKDFSCLVEGHHDSRKTSFLESRKELMSFLSDFCTSSKIKVLPSTLNAESQNKESLFLWAERVSFALVGFALCAFVLQVKRKRKSLESVAENYGNTEGAIVLTKIVERSPDEAAKWMVKALLSEPLEKDQRKIKSNNSEARIIDDSL